ncbi:MAG TPA: Rdx family protein [Puia sp.]|jgi:selenoprotein W-related protein|nr:Rdx family protein [Puia sp.]
MKPIITIEYCPQCGWMLRAAYMAQELLTTFTGDIHSVSLQPATLAGTYLISIDGELLFDRRREGRFPEIKELKQLVRDKVSPQKSLGHSDRQQPDRERTDRQQPDRQQPDGEQADYQQQDKQQPNG